LIKRRRREAGELFYELIIAQKCLLNEISRRADPVKVDYCLLLLLLPLQIFLIADFRFA
jgi:hypothetical protein